MPRTADVGPANYARVNELVEQGMKKSEAFRAVAEEELGTAATPDELQKKAQSVATNYYRLDRQKREESGEVVEPKKRGRPKGSKNKPKDETTASPTPTVVSGKNGYESDALTALGQAKTAIDAAIEAARATAAELDDLRDFKQKVTSVFPSS